MNVHVLGPFEVVSNDGTVVRPQGHAAHLLAALAHSAGRAVSTENLIHVLWGEQPPSTARASLQVYIAKIRKIVADTSTNGNQPIETQSGAYRLIPTELTVDVAQFRALAEQAIQLPPSHRSAHLKKALAVWRGRPYEPWSSDSFFVGDATSLEELRDRLEEDLVDSELGLGRHQAQVAHLRALVQAAPLRERRWRQLMLALYRSGRRAEALRSYQQLRALLGTELGIEPGPEVAKLEEAILFDDQALLFTDQSGRQGTALVTLPDPGTTFVGRSREIADIKALIERHPLVTLTGPGGVGKTRIAVETARTASNGLAQPPIFVDLSDITEPGSVMNELASATGCPTADSDDKAVLENDILKTVAASSSVLIFDNCEHLLETVSGIVERIHACRPELRILATSLEPLGVTFEAVYQLDPLPVPTPGAAPSEIIDAAAVQLFVDRAKQRSQDFALSDTNISALAQICRLLDGLPLAIELAATSLGTLSPKELAAELEHTFAPLSDVRRGTNARHKTLAATVDWSYQRLDQSSQRLLRRLSVFRNGWTLQDARAVIDLENEGLDSVRAGLRMLVNRSLVDFTTPTAVPRFRLLEPIRRIAWNLCAEAGELETIRASHAAFYRSIADEALADTDGSNRATWYLHFEAERENYRAAINWAIENAACHYHTSLVPAVSRYWFRRDINGDQEKLIQRALDCYEGHNSDTATTLLLYAGQSALASGNPAVAEDRLERFAALHSMAQDDVTQLYWQVRGNLIGFGYGMPAASITSFEKAVAIGEPIRSARTLMSHSLLGYMKARTLDHAGALETVQAMAPWHDKSPVWHKIAVDQILGLSAFYEGELDEGAQRLRRSIDTLHTAGRSASIPAGVVHAGWALLEAGHVAEATLLVGTSLEQVPGTNTWQHAGLMSILGRCTLRVGDHERATGLFFDSLNSAMHGPTRDTMTWGLVGLGFALSESRNRKMAVTALIAAWTLMEEYAIALPLTERDRYFDLLEDFTEELGDDRVADIEHGILTSGIDATVATIRASAL